MTSLDVCIDNYLTEGPRVIKPPEEKRVEETPDALPDVEITSEADPLKSQRPAAKDEVIFERSYYHKYRIDYGMPIVFKDPPQEIIRKHRGRGRRVRCFACSSILLLAAVLGATVFSVIYVVA